MFTFVVLAIVVVGVVATEVIIGFVFVVVVVGVVATEVVFFFYICLMSNSD